jgi:hypothetical protein
MKIIIVITKTFCSVFYGVLDIVYEASYCCLSSVNPILHYFADSKNILITHFLQLALKDDKALVESVQP